MSQETSGGAPPSDMPPYEDNGTAPIIYFDLAAAMGVLAGAVQIELAHRILIPIQGEDGVRVKFIAGPKIRCSPTAAISLRDAIDKALKMLEQPQQQPAAASKLN